MSTSKVPQRPADGDDHKPHAQGGLHGPAHVALVPAEGQGALHGHQEERGKSLREDITPEALTGRLLLHPAHVRADVHHLAPGPGWVPIRSGLGPGRV